MGGLPAIPIGIASLTLHQVFDFSRSLGERLSWSTLRNARRRVSIQDTHCVFAK